LQSEKGLQYLTAVIPIWAISQLWKVHMNRDRTEPKHLTVALTDAPPVRIETDRWPIIASFQKDFADYRWSLVVRRHEDCRTIVYGQEHWGSSSDPEYFGPEAGVLVPAVNPMEDQNRLIARKIAEVGKSLSFADYFSQACIASMVPEELD
jgi:hypothetical protein